MPKKVWWKGKRNIFNTYKFSNHDNNKFILLLQKYVYPFEYMDDWENFIEVCKHFEIKEIRGVSWFACSKQYIIVSWCI